jgi:hypothetical protein
MNNASKIIIGSGMPMSHNKAPCPNPMATSIDIVDLILCPAGVQTGETFAIGYRIIMRMMRLIGTPSNQSRIGIACSYYLVG